MTDNEKPSDESQRIAFLAPIHLRLFQDGLINLLTLSTMVFVDYGLLRALNWLAPEYSSFFKYTQIAVFLIAIVSSLTTLALLIRSAYRVQKTRQYRILLVMRKTEGAFFKQIQENVHRLVGEESRSNV